MKKKVNDILKGVAGAGIALGGAAAFGEGDLIYAAEMEQSESLSEEFEEQTYASASSSES